MSVRRTAISLLGLFAVVQFFTLAFLHVWPYRQAVDQYLQAQDVLARVDETNQFQLGVVRTATYILWERAEREYDRLTSLEHLLIPHRRKNFQDPRTTDFPDFKHYTDDQIIVMYQALRGKIQEHYYFVVRPQNRNLQSRVL